jgi:phospholipase/carboxylesterase
MHARPDAEAPPAATIRRVAVEAIGYYYIDEPKGAAARCPALVGLHGYAQTATEFLKLLRSLAPESWTCVAPQGFNQIWDPKSGAISFNWMTAFERWDSVERNNAFLDRALGELEAEGRIDPRRIVLLGFSQGSSVAYRYAQRRPGRVAGIVSVCADLPADVEADPAPLAGVKFLIAYGADDPYVPTAKPERAIAALRGAGLDVDVHRFTGGHRVASSIGPAMRDWMKDLAR